MNKLVIISAIILIIVIGGFFIFSGDNATEEEASLDDVPESEFSSLETNDDVFNEIDSTLETLG